ncbi:transcription elongation factor GreA [Isoptericola sp. NEAU-Y5]|uniref:Transcription elongation factor GreA n=1 Tax=Isoptericola luteus TaxID=2879484 RepID=A0ABS7ZCN7_9MICO|nr:transcription elongation factor GreA [Isoptericola sp. NEAU-Y5]MCA5892818.1 transcription elongation factor GreA [Isoptericola sp. NEAU-Y5]
MTESTVTWLTQEAHDRLKAELEHLSGPARTEIAERIAAARDEGDLKENGGYHAAREEQAKNEARIRELTEKLRSIRIGTPADDGIVEAGMVVTAVVAGDEMTFLLGSREIADTTDLDVYSPTSPLGAAIDGRPIGEKVSYTAPNGKEIPVEIKGAKPFSG